MQILRRIRGLIGTAITWAIVGGLLGASFYLIRYQPWQAGTVWGRALRLLGAFLGAGALWGAACGLAFGLAIWGLGRHSQLHQLSVRRVTWWGALGGVSFPLLLYTPLVLVSGAVQAVPLFAVLTVMSAALGAVSARALFAVARRAPELPGERGILGMSPSAVVVEMIPPQESG
ncbi:MAG: hypothetical protein V4558_13430 [Gemmatimonadota bacterium]